MAEETDTPITNFDDILAAELALSLLEGEDKASALQKQLSDPGFAHKVEAWNKHLSPLLNEIEESQPSFETWSGIAEKIKLLNPPESINIVNLLDRQLKRWRAAAIGSGAVAASLALVLLLNNDIVSPQVDGVIEASSNQLAVSQLTGPIEGLVLVASYNPSNAQMKIDVSGMPETETQPEIWIVAANQAPQSLGQIGRDGISEMTVANDHRPLINATSTLVLTMEPASDTPHVAPSGEAVASGKITFL